MFSYIISPSSRLYINLFYDLVIRELPSLKVNPNVLVENSTGVFRCEAKLKTSEENITDNHLPYMKLYFANDPNQELPAVMRRDAENNTLTMVSHYHL